MQRQINAIRGTVNTHSSNFVSIRGHVQNLLGWQRSAKVQLGQLTGIKNDLNALKTWKNNHNTWAGNQARRISTLEGWRNSHNTWASNQAKRITANENWIKTHNTWAGNQAKRITANENWIKNHNIWAGNQAKRITSLEDWRNRHVTWANDQAKRISSLESWKNTQNAWNAGQLVWNTNQSNRINELEKADKSLLNALNTEREERKKNDKKLENTLLKEAEDRKAVDTALGLKIASLDLAIEKLNQRLDNLTVDFSDVGIIAAIALASKQNTDLWNADNYDGGSVGANDGKAVRLFKNQFQGLKTHFAGIMKYYFNINDPDSAFSILKSSVVESLELVADSVNNFFVYTLDKMDRAFNLQEEYFVSFYDTFSTFEDWLEKLYKKPPPIVNVSTPPFDYERLQKMLEGISFNIGDINNEAGTNLWDVLDGLFDNLGKIFDTALKEIGQLLRDLLAFLDGLLDDIVHLVVPENLDFMHKKFDSTGEKIKLKFPFIFGWIDSFKGLFGGQSKIEDQAFNLNGMFDGEVKLPFSKLNDFAPIIRGFATGFVLLGFLIDMYHWFHSRGEVVE